MQSELHANSTRDFTTSSAAGPLNTSQHGFHPDHLPSANERDGPREERVELADSGPNRVSETGFSEEFQRRLSVNDRGNNKPKPSFQQIAEYENALAPSPLRRQNEGPGFKVIKRKGGTSDGLQLAEFPNGTFNLAVNYDSWPLRAFQILTM